MKTNLVLKNIIEDEFFVLYILCKYYVNKIYIHTLYIFVTKKMCFNFLFSDYKQTN